MDRSYRHILLTFLTTIGLLVSPQMAKAMPHAQSTGPDAAADRTDALLIYHSDAEQASANGFRRAVDFYGLILTELDLSSDPLTEAVLRDEAGDCYPTILIAGATLASLDEAELDVLHSALVDDGCNLMVTTLHEDNTALSTLTDGAIEGGTALTEPYHEYTVTAVEPAVTREFSDAQISVPDQDSTEPRPAHALALASDAPAVDVLINGTDAGGEAHPVFAVMQTDGGRIFASSDTPDDALRYNPLHENYYNMARFAQIVPLMMFVRDTAGDEAWHRNENFANLTIDDPGLSPVYMDYEGVLAEAKAHNFHITVALPPGHTHQSTPDVLELFLNNPDYLSVVPHGNNHDGYEFYQYTVEEDSEHEARPLSEQEADLVEALARMESFSQQTGVPYAPVMIFPTGIAPTETLEILKQYNYLATINGINVPLGDTREWSSGMKAPMRPADLTFSNFASVRRHLVGGSTHVFDLFLDKPVFLYQHTGLFENHGLEGFNSHATAINEAHGEVTWQGLGHIMKRLYLTKRNDDGTFDVMFYTNQLVLTNDSNQEQTLHVKREETANVPIVDVTVDGESVTYSVENDQLQIDLTMPPGATREIQIRYRPSDRDFAVDASDISVDVETGVVEAAVHNLASENGPVPVGFWLGTSDLNSAPLALAMAEDVEAGSSAIITATLPVSAELATDAAVTMVADPYNLIAESNEDNNRVSTGDRSSTSASDAVQVQPEQDETQPEQEQTQSGPVETESASEGEDDSFGSRILAALKNLLSSNR